MRVLRAGITTKVESAISSLLRKVSLIARRVSKIRSSLVVKF